MNITSSHTKFIYKFLAIGFLLALSVSSYAQDWSRYGYQSFGEKDYHGAAYYFHQALQMDSVDLEIYWHYAESERLANNYKKASQAYKELMELDENVNYPAAVFHRADMLKRQEQYEEAGVYFEFFRDVCPDKKDILYKRAKEEVQACLLAQSWQSMKDRVEIQHPAFDLNSYDAEFSPTFVSDSHIIFSALRFDTMLTKQIDQSADNYKSFIYDAFLTENGWELGPLDFVINDSLVNNANPTLTADSSQMYFTRSDKKGSAIYVSNWYEDHWQNAVKLGPNVNEEGSMTTHPNVATLNNGKTYLFFASNRSKTRGKMDIWTVEIKDNGTKFGRPKNAGRKVNTKDDEITPFFNEATGNLYFSSVYHPGFGGFDVFKSSGLPRKFVEPQNVGKPINSSVNDMYYTEVDTTGKGAFISNRADGYALKGETCCNDIYFFGPIGTSVIDTVLVDIPVEENLEVRLQAVQFLPLALYFDNDKPNSNSRAVSTNLTYKQTFDSYLERKPKFLQQAPNKSNIDSFFVKDVEVGFIKLQMLSDSLVKYLDMGYKLQLGVKGFTSPLGDADYNDNLALRRISSIENYLYQANNNRLQPAIDSGLLKFRQIPFGEFFSINKVSDDLKSKKQSVYSAPASEARKVEIIWVEQTLPGDSNAIANFQSTIYNFGEMASNSEVETVFKFTNSGEKPLIIENVEASCDCISTHYPIEPVLPGESGEIHVFLNNLGKKGLQFHGLVVTTNEKTKEHKLFIQGVMERLEDE